MSHSDRINQLSLKVKNHENKRKAIVIEDPVEPEIQKQVKPNQEIPTIDRDMCPWYSKQTAAIKHPTLRLHNEIIEFFQYITPTDQEHNTRQQAFERVKSQLLEWIPTATLETFGSFRTKLYLPNADIDMVLIEEKMSSKQLYKKVASAIMNQTAKYENINLIAHAKVPIIKFVEIETQFHFDLSFNKLDGVNQIAELNKAIDIYPEMKYLILVVKCILRQRDLHETYSGGVGSFLLFQMILAFLREFRKDAFAHHKQDNLKNVTMGEYLLKFMEFYGQKFDIHRKRIIMIAGGNIVNKPTQDDRFSLISPQDPDHDIGHSSYKIREVNKILLNRYNFMTNYNFKPGESVLRYILNPAEQKFTFLKPIV